jgi:uncharacterized protein (UPF0332 family)
LNELLKNNKKLEKTIKDYKKKGIIRKTFASNPEINGHVDKTKHNLKFAKDNLKLGYVDWSITGCYYALYHTSIALTLKKGYFSKNHNGTICLLIKNYYEKILEKDIELMNKLFLNHKDFIFYTQTKEKRKNSTYSTDYFPSKKEVELLRKETIKLVNKMLEILNQNDQNKS